MNEKPLVSIICTVYNHEPFLRQCLDGFVMQKTNFKFEAIVHDDCSTDGSAAIIREYAEKYPDIIKPIYEEENQYSKGTLDKVINPYLKGKYIALCEGDDYWTDPLKLQKQVDFLETHKDYSLICGRYKCYNYSSKIWKTDSFWSRTNRDVLFKDKEGVTFQYEDLENYGWLPKTLTLMYRFLAAKEFFEYKGHSRDYVLVYFVLKNGLGYCLNDIMGVYNIHIGSIFSSVSTTRQAIDNYIISRDLYLYEKNRNTESIYKKAFIDMLYFTNWFFLLKEKPQIWKFKLMIRVIHGKVAYWKKR
jgi:glycosyltransferase involved in cell wall biosynthesis